MNYRPAGMVGPGRVSKPDRHSPGSPSASTQSVWHTPRAVRMLSCSCEKQTGCIRDLLAYNCNTLEISLETVGAPIMESTPVLICPKCSAAVRMAPLGLLPVDETGSETGNILKRCPRCRVWSWMTLQHQEA